MFIATQFTTATIWKQPRCPLTEEWIKKLWYIYIYIYIYIYKGILFSHKKNAFESVLMRWMNLEPIIQIELSQKGENKYHVLKYI